MPKWVWCLYCLDRIEASEESADAIGLDGVNAGVVHAGCAKAWKRREIERQARRTAMRWQVRRQLTNEAIGR